MHQRLWTFRFLATTPVGLWQVSITLFVQAIEPIMTDTALATLGVVGNILIFCIGINIIIDGRGRIKVANLMTAIILAVAAAFIPLI